MPSNDGGPNIVTRKINLRGPSDDSVVPVEMPASGLPFTEKNYNNPGDPNHLHYYIWKWYSQISGGKDDVMRHAIAGEHGNDIKVLGPGMTVTNNTGSHPTTVLKKFIVLITPVEQMVQDGRMFHTLYHSNGKYYNNNYSSSDFRGEGILLKI